MSMSDISLSDHHHRDISRDAPNCDICRGNFDCHTCPERPFGSAPCTDCEDVDCAGCPNQWICAEISAREWPLAELAIRLSMEGVI